MESVRGVMSPEEGKKKGGAWKSNPLFPAVNLRIPIFPSCSLNKAHPPPLT
jgi:hypothetical protein